MELVLLVKIEGLVLDNPTNADASLLLTLEVPPVCPGMPPPFLTDSVAQPCKCLGADQWQQIPDVTYP